MSWRTKNLIQCIAYLQRASVCHKQSAFLLLHEICDAAMHGWFAALDMHAGSRTNAETCRMHALKCGLDHMPPPVGSVSPRLMNDPHLAPDSPPARSKLSFSYVGIRSLLQCRRSSLVDRYNLISPSAAVTIAPLLSPPSLVLCGIRHTPIEKYQHSDLATLPPAARRERCAFRSCRRRPGQLAA